VPYRYAFVFLLLIFPLAGLAFWQSYLSGFTTASAEFHAHGVTATLWLVLLTLQSWSIHNGRPRLHRTLGTASLALFPLFLAGGSAIFIGMAQRFVSDASPFYALYAPRLAWLDVFAVLGFAWFYFEGLRNRGEVASHSRWMLATVIFLLAPIFGRLMPMAIPPLAPTGPDDLWKLGVGFQIANGLIAVIAFALALRAGRHARPFLAAGILTIAAALFYEFVGGTEAWRALFARAAVLPWAPMAAVAATFGIAVATAGWLAARRPATSAAPA